jgi:hypothetical protein
MLRRVCLAAVLCMLVPAALSDVRIFFTNSSDPYGLTKPQNAFAPSFGAGLDAATEDADGNPVDPPLQVAAFPAYSTAIPWPDPSRAEFVYIWIQLYSTGSLGDPTYLPTNGTLFSMTLSVQGNPSDVAWYCVNNSNGDGRKRWEGAATPPDYPEFSHATMQNLTAVTAYGIKNASAADPTQLWSGGANNGTTGRIALLGAIRPGPDDLGFFGITVAIEQGTGAPLVAYRPTSGSPYPVTTISGQYMAGIPEPASVALLGLAVLMLRRR